jgi:hypothetical protein
MLADIQSSRTRQGDNPSDEIPTQSSSFIAALPGPENFEINYMKINSVIRVLLASR